MGSAAKTNITLRQRAVYLTGKRPFAISKKKWRISL
nr:MAG TPA: hypothetical protein [Caudoviricetes sp.]